MNKEDQSLIDKNSSENFLASNFNKSQLNNANYYIRYAKTHQLNQTQKIALRLIQFSKMYLAFFCIFIIFLVMLIVFIVDNFNFQVPIFDASIAFVSILFIFVEISNVALIIYQIKLEKSKEENKKIWIPYFLGLFTIIPSLITIAAMFKTYKKTFFGNEINEDELFKETTKEYIRCYYYYFRFSIPFIIMLIVAIACAVIIKGAPSPGDWVILSMLIFIVVLLFLFIESLNIILIVKSSEIRKKCPEKIKKSWWICHILSLVLIFPSLLIISLVMKQKRTWFQEQNNQQ